MKKYYTAGLLLILLGGCAPRSIGNFSYTEKVSNSLSIEKVDKTREQMEEADSLRESNVEGRKEVKNRIVIVVGGKKFPAVLAESETAQLFKADLPMTLRMKDMHKNEKYYYLDKDYPFASERVETIQTGDLLLYGSDCLVLFYKSFATSYSYTRIAHVIHPLELEKELGKGTAEVTFELGN